MIQLLHFRFFSLIMTRQSSGRQPKHLGACHPYGRPQSSWLWISSATVVVAILEPTNGRSLSVSCSLWNFAFQIKIDKFIFKMYWNPLQVSSDTRTREAQAKHTYLSNPSSDIWRSYNWWSVSPQQVLVKPQTFSRDSPFHWIPTGLKAHMPLE